MKMRKKYIFSVLSFIFICSLFSMMVFIEHQRNLEQKNKEMDLLRVDVKDRFENNITSRLIAMNGLASLIRINPEFSQEDYEIYIVPIYEGSKDLVRNITFITNTMITHVYPYESNQSALGVDLAQNPLQRDLILYAKETGQSIFTAPVNLVQGGTGIVSRIPLNDETGYFGQVAIVFDYDAVIEELGLESLTDKFHMKLTINEPIKHDEKIIWSSGEIVNDDDFVIISLYDSEMYFYLEQANLSMEWTPLMQLMILLGITVSSIFAMIIYKLMKVKEALLDSNENLEKEVKLRTLELLSSNEELVSINDALSSTIKTLEYTQHRLVESEKLAALGNIIIGVAHQINTPVGIGMTSSSYLKDKLDNISVDSRLLEAASLSFHSFEKIAHLVNEFKMISVSPETAREKVNIKKIIDEAVSMSALGAKVKHQIKIHCDEKEYLYIEKKLFQNILIHLISNAYIYAFDENVVGMITIEYQKEGSFSKLVIKDNGKGMEKKIKDKIFEPFFTTNRGNLGGTGLGLYMVYNIVNHVFKGEIQCDSAPGEGTRFTIKTPL